MQHPDYPNILLKPAIAAIDLDQTHDRLQFTHLPQGFDTELVALSIPSYEDLAIDRFTPYNYPWCETYADKLYNFLKPYNYSPQSTISLRFGTANGNIPIIVTQPNTTRQFPKFEHSNKFDPAAVYEVEFRAGVTYMTYLYGSNLFGQGFTIYTLQKAWFKFQFSNPTVVNITPYLVRDNEASSDMFIANSLVFSDATNLFVSYRPNGVTNNYLLWEDIDSYFSEVTTALSNYFSDKLTLGIEYADSDGVIRLAHNQLPPQQYMTRAECEETNTPGIVQPYIRQLSHGDYAYTLGTFPSEFTDLCYLARANNNYWNNGTLLSDLGYITKARLQQDQLPTINRVEYAAMKGYSYTFDSRNVFSGGVDQKWLPDTPTPRERGYDAGKYLMDYPSYDDYFDHWRGILLNNFLTPNEVQTWDVDGTFVLEPLNTTYKAYVEHLWDLGNGGIDRDNNRFGGHPQDVGGVFFEGRSVTIANEAGSWWFRVLDELEIERIGSLDHDVYDFVKGWRGNSLQYVVMDTQLWVNLPSPQTFYDYIQWVHGMFEHDWEYTFYPEASWDFTGATLTIQYRNDLELGTIDDDSTTFVETLYIEQFLYTTTDIADIYIHQSTDDLTFYNWIVERISDFNMVDSIRIKEIHATLGAGEWAYQDEDLTPAYMNLSRKVDLLAKANGLSFNLDGSIISLRQRKNIPYTDGVATIPDGWVRGQFGLNTGESEDGQEGGLVTEQRLGIAYQNRSNRYTNDAVCADGSVEILETDNAIQRGDIVLCESWLQYYEAFLDDLDKGLNWQEMGAAIVPNADNTGKYCRFEGMGTLLADLSWTVSHLSRNIIQSHIMNLKQEAILIELLKATGLPITAGNIRVKVGVEEGAAWIPYPTVSPDAPSLTQLSFQILSNLAPLLANCMDFSEVESE